MPFRWEKAVLVQHIPSASYSADVCYVDAQTQVRWPSQAAPQILTKARDEPKEEAKTVNDKQGGQAKTEGTGDPFYQK
jgi:hypothetical protein